MHRTIKRYGGGSRKLYDTRQSRYISLDEIPELIRRGDDVEVVDSRTGRDVTVQTLAQVMYETERRGTGLLSAGILHELIRRGEAALRASFDYLTWRWVMPKAKKEELAPFTLKNSVQQIWLAGLGAFALAGEEGMKMFSSLVERGQEVEQLNKERLENVLGRVSEIRGETGKAIMGRIGAPIDAGMTTAMHQLGIPTRKEILTLTKRVEELTRTVNATKKTTRKRSKKAKA